LIVLLALLLVIGIIVFAHLRAGGAVIGVEPRMQFSWQAFSPRSVSGSRMSRALADRFSLAC